MRKMRKKERIAAFLMALLMLFSFVDLPAYAVEMTTIKDTDNIEIPIDSETTKDIETQTDVASEVERINALSDDADTAETSGKSMPEGEFVYTDYGISGPQWNDNGTVSWDCVYFGRFWQSDTNGDGTVTTDDEKEPIKWRVLSVSGNQALLLSDRNITGKNYNTTCVRVTWANCTLRSWLNAYGADCNLPGKDYRNNSFMGKAFKPGEKKAIISANLINTEIADSGMVVGTDTTDKIFLLSEEDAFNPAYGFRSTNNTPYGYNYERISVNTAFTATTGVAYDREGEPNSWWLRAKGEAGINVPVVSIIGWVSSSPGLTVGQPSNIVGVRPALYLDLSYTDYWSKAESVTADVSGNLTEASPSISPSKEPSASPIVSPSAAPSPIPSEEPSVSPSTEVSPAPSIEVSEAPSKEPSAVPSEEPGVTPSTEVSTAPSTTPSAVPSEEPSVSPSTEVSTSPSIEVSAAPSEEPSAVPSEEPGVTPSTEVSTAPSITPSAVPSEEPSVTPSTEVSTSPSIEVSAAPSEEPSAVPSEEPGVTPSTEVSAVPSEEPSAVPSVSASEVPSESPSTQPIASPSTTPSISGSKPQVDVEVSISQNDLETKNQTELNKTVAEAISQTVDTVVSKGINYSGSKQSIGLSLTLGGTQLAEGTDFSVKYTNAVNAGYANMDIKFLGDYKNLGTVSKTFAINAINIAGDEVAVANLYYEYKGKAVKPVPVLYYNGRKLRAGKDFEYDKTAITANKTITIKGIGNFTGSRNIEVTLIDKTKETRTALAKAKVTINKKLIYTGTAVEPTGTDFVVTLGSGKNKVELKQGVDYTVEFSNNNQPGTATAVIRSLDSSKNCYGERLVTFKIAGTKLTKATVTLSLVNADGIRTVLGTKKGMEAVSTGSAVSPDVTVKLTKANGEAVELKEGTDYTVSYKKNRKKGTASVIITGIGAYTGTKTVKFKIIEK